MFRGPAIVLLLGLVIPSWADDAPVFPGEIASLGRRFEELARKESAARKNNSETLWTEYLDELLTLSGASGNDLAALGSSQVVQVRRAVQYRLSRLPADVLRQYRRRADTQARKSVEEGQAGRDPRLLQRVVEEAFCTEAARTALETLGDLAFERGDFEEANGWWRLITAHHPDARAIEPALQARQLLARWFAGDRSDDWSAALDAFRRNHPDAEGHLAGSKGLYWKRLSEIAQRERDAPAIVVHDWPTFAGAPSRNRSLPAEALTPDSLTRLVRDGVQWTIPLTSERPLAEQEVKSPAEFARSLAFCPIIIDTKVVFADARSVIALDIKSGKREVWCDASQLTEGFTPNLMLPAPADLRYTLTATDECVLVRLGVQGLRSDRKEREQSHEGASVLACLTRTPDAQGNRLRWRVLLDGAKNNLAFEGSPVADNAQVYIAVARLESNRTTTAIHCYGLAGKKTPALRWKRDVCSTRELPAGETRYRHHLLTLAGGQLYYCTHSGAVVALDTATGRQTWGLRYRSVRASDDETRPAYPRDVNPCVFAEGLLYAAPADSDLLLCLDPWTGAIVWERDRIEVQHLLGVVRGRVLFTTRTPSAGLRALNAGDGSDRGGWFRTGADAPVHSLGRGLLAGELVVWPTLHHVYFVRQDDGEQAADATTARGVPSGNMAFGDGILAVADRENLHVFAPPRFRLPERKKEAEERPRSALEQFRLGTALADAGQPEQAVDCFRKAALLADPSLRELAWMAEQRALFAAAERERIAGRPDQSATLIDCAAGHYFPPSLRGQALQRGASFWMRSGERARAVVCCQALLKDRELTRCSLLDDRGRPQTAHRWASAWLEREGETKAATPKREASSLPPSVVLSLPLLRSWSRALGTGERVLFPEGTMDRYFTARGRALSSHDATTGNALWQRELTFIPQWIGSHADTVLVAGDDGAACLACKDGQVLWEHWQSRGLSGFQIVAGRLFFLEEQRRLFALDAETGSVLWTRRAQSSFLRWPDKPGRIRSFEAGENFVFLPDRSEVLDAATGTILGPLAADAIVSIDPKTGQQRWSRSARMRSTLNGLPVQRLSLGPESFLAIVPRNHGTTMERIDGGDWRWSTLLRTSAPALASISRDSSAAYLAQEHELSAYALEDGKRLWTQRLTGPGGSWRTARVGDWLLAWPIEREKLAVPVPLTWGRLECLLTWNAEDTVPLVICEARTGVLVQRLNVPARSVNLRVKQQGTSPEEELIAVARTPKGLLIRTSGVLFSYDAGREH